MSPERVDDAIVQLCSRWLARHIGNPELAAELERVDPTQLQPGQAEAVAELRAALTAAGETRTATLEVVLRETIEALAMGI
ncbi:MAG: hypothetical protein QOE29_710 [Gaiellaceae bacterium]|jgi:hypothetical protein|nr:hypothetical protein [Gaiellaceae bacterium]